MLKPELTIPLENKPGALAEVTGILDSYSINIEAIFATAYQHMGLARFIVDQPQTARKLLAKRHMRPKGEVFSRDIVNPKVVPGSMADFVGKISGAGVQMYSLYTVPSNERVGAVISVDPDNEQEAANVIRNHDVIQYYPNVITIHVPNEVGGLKPIIDYIDIENVQLTTIAVTEVIDSNVAIGKLIVENPEVALKILADIGCLPPDSPAVNPGWLIVLKNEAGALHNVLVDFDDHNVNMDCVFTAPAREKSSKRVVVVLDDEKAAGAAVDGVH